MFFAKHSASPLYAVKSFLNNSLLISQFVRRDISSQFRGSVFGLFWSLFTPLIMLAVYGFVFTVVFNARFGLGVDEPEGGFAVVLFSGLILHSFFSDVICKSPAIVMQNVNLVTKVIFPLEILVPSSIFSSLFQLIVSFFVLILGVLFIYGDLNITILLAPFVLFPFVVLSIGVGWILSSTGVYVRDIAHLTGVVSTILLFLSTIFYPADSLPEYFQSFIYLNPLSYVVDQFRDVVLYGRGLDWYSFGLYSLVSFGVFAFGFWWFQKTRNGFADVL